MTENNQRYIFNFKLPNMDKPVIFSFLPYVTVKEFTDFMLDEISYLKLKPYKAIEIVETDQLHDIDFSNAEKLPKINYSENLTLREVYGDKWKTISFYIRVIPL